MILHPDILALPVAQVKNHMSHKSLQLQYFFGYVMFPFVFFFPNIPLPCH